MRAIEGNLAAIRGRRTFLIATVALSVIALSAIVAGCWLCGVVTGAEIDYWWLGIFGMVSVTCVVAAIACSVVLETQFGAERIWRMRIEQRSPQSDEEFDREVSQEFNWGDTQNAHGSSRFRALLAEYLGVNANRLRLHDIVPAPLLETLDTTEFDEAVKHSFDIQLPEFAKDEVSVAELIHAALKSAMEKPKVSN